MNLLRELVAAIYAASTGVFGVATILLLVFFLFLKEIIRTSRGPSGRAWMHRLDLVIVPLLLAFGLLIAVRLISL